MEDVSWFLAAYSKIQEERDKPRKEMVSKKEPEHDDLENSQPVHIAGNAKACSGEFIKGAAGKPSGEIRFVTMSIINHLSRS